MNTDQTYETDLEDAKEVLDNLNHLIENSSDKSIYTLGEAASRAREQFEDLYQARNEIGYDNLPEEAQELIDEYQQTRSEVRADPSLPNTLEGKDCSLGIYVERRLSGGNT